MPTQTRIAVLPAGDGPFEIREATLPDPGPHEIVVRQLASGICHSNLPRMYGPPPRTGDNLAGHESTGIVEATGSAVERVRIGDRVIVTWVPRFESDGSRRRDSVRLAFADGREISTAALFTWSEAIVVDDQFVLPLPDDIPAVPASILGCAVMTGAGAVVNTAGDASGTSVAIFGVGGVGLWAIAAARIACADPIIAVDLTDEKLQMAKAFGATHLVNATDADPVERIHDLTRSAIDLDGSGRPVAGVDVAIDCVGAPTTMTQIFRSARSMVLGRTRGGTAVLVGVPLTSVTLDALDFHLNEKRYIGSLAGSCRPDTDIPRFIDWFRRGLLDLEALVTRRYPLAEIPQAVADLEAGRIVGRAVIDFSLR